MDIFVLRVFPLLLAAGALFLAWGELRQPALTLQIPPRIRKFFRMRMWRRVGGSAILLLVAFQIWTGQLPQQPQPTELALEMLQHWASVFVLVCLLVLFAIWDTWEGVRHLRTYLEAVEMDELGKIRQHLEKTPGGLSVLNQLDPE